MLVGKRREPRNLKGQILLDENRDEYRCECEPHIPFHVFSTDEIQQATAAFFTGNFQHRRSQQWRSQKGNDHDHTNSNPANV